MKLKLLGYRESKEHHDSDGDNYEHDTGHTNWALFFENETKELFVVNVKSAYGSCGSGWGGANWGNIEQIKPVKSGNLTLNMPKKDVFIETLPGNKLNVQFQDPNEPFDAEVEKLFSTEGELIAQSTGDGGDGYYPSGTASINMELFS